MLGFKYFTESEALFAKRVCDEAAGFPVNPDNITTDAASYHCSGGINSANQIIFGNASYNGSTAEYVTYHSNQSINQEGIRANINSFYKIY
jgi:hypothetical protein